MTQERFNKTIADAYGEDDPEIRDWLATTMGRKFAGGHIGESAEGTCPVCERTGQIATRRRNAAYADDTLNWMTSCEDCFQEDYEQLASQWEDYYSMVM